MKDFFPKVSVIVPIEEISDNTYKSIDNVLKQTYKNIEVIVVGIKDKVEIIKNKYQDKCLYQTVNTFEINNALNTGIKESKGEYISFLFNDDLIKLDKIEKELVAFSKSKQTTGFVFTNKIDTLTNKEKEELEEGEFSDFLTLTGNINRSSFLFKKEVFDKYKFNNKKTVYLEYLLLELSKKYKTAIINDQAVEQTKKPIYSEEELIDLWKEVLKTKKEKDLISNYTSLHNLYNKGIETFNNYDLIFPKELHDLFIKNTYNPLISVIIPVYNGSNYVAEAIKSVLRQTYDNYELLVIEDGSTDGGLTKKAVLEFEDNLTYYHKENGGVGSALNLGIEKAKGKYISWLSHDDMFYPEKLQMAVDALNELDNKDTIIFSNFQLMDENSIPYVDTNFQNRFPIEKMENKIFPVLNGSTNGCAMLIPKVAFDKCGLFDVSQRTTNDYIMWFNIFREFPSKFLIEHLIKYRIHKKQDSQSSPIYVPECEDMWTSVFKKITKKEIEDYGYSELEFYAKFYNEMRLGGLLETASYLEEQYKKAYEKNGPLVSVIMPCYNSEKFLKKAVDSILNQSLVAFELICVDDLSTDSTYSILKEYEKKDFRVKAVKNTHKKGVAGAMNTGLELAKGEYISRMDSDDISYPERLMKEFNFLKEHKEYGTCTVNIDLREDDMIVGRGTYYNDDTPLEWKFLWNNPYPNAPSMFRKELVKDLRFNEELNVAEDYQFFMNLAQHKIYYIDDVQYSYRINRNSLYHKNRLKSILNSIEVSSAYYYEITKNETLPEIYYYLTDFSGEEIPDFEINHQETLKFIDKTVEDFKKHFKWTDKETTNAKEYAITYVYGRLLEKITRKNSYEAKELAKITHSASWIITKPLRLSARVFKKGKHFAGRVIKKVMR